MKELLNNPKVTLISYAAEYGGSALRRIIISHNPYYSELENPISYPKHVEGFIYHNTHFLNFKEQHLACAHTEDMPIAMNDEVFLKDQINKIDEGFNICLRTHDFEDEEELEKAKIIRLYGDCLDRFKKAPRYVKQNNRFYGKNFIPPSDCSHVCNIIASNLFSLDFDKYLEEYLKITTYLDIVPKVNSVRQFILMWLEKQERFNLTLS